MAPEVRWIERAVFEPIDVELDALRREGWRLVAASRSGESQLILKLKRTRVAPDPFALAEARPA
jgi:hypothetical protein